MDERMYRSYMMQAKQIGGEYGAGYQRGLRRHHHGETFGTAEKHRKWMRAADEPHRADLGRGYRDGFAGHPPRETAEEPEATLNVRGINAQAAARIKAAAAARSLTIGEYLAKLVTLHDHMRHLADSGKHDQLAAELGALGLQTVTA